MLATDGWPARLTTQVLALAAAQGDISPERGRCHDVYARGATPCVLGARTRAEAMLWGDSHGVELAYALGEQARREGRALIERTTSSCPPVLAYDDPKDARCAAANRAAFAALRADPAIRRVYLVAFWANGLFDEPGFVANLDRTIAAIRALGREVVLIGPVPPQPFDVPRHLAHLARAGHLDQARGVERRWVEARTVRLRAALARWQARGVRVIDPVAAQCGPQYCAIIRGSAPLYFDSHHLSLTGARQVIAHGG